MLIAFDLDNTLAESKSRIDERMVNLLNNLIQEVEVCIISGGQFTQFESQVLQYLRGPFDKLHLMPTCGTQYYRWNAGWQVRYAENLSPQESEQAIQALVQGAIILDLWEDRHWGNVVEDRGSQITFSALGQSAPVWAKEQWDCTGTKKSKLRSYVAGMLPNLEVHSGGTTSIDITKKGIDKAYGMRKLMTMLDIGISDVLFVGDRLDPGGNDYPVKKMGINCVAVSCWQDTALFLESRKRNQLPEEV
jgi:phosphomannomutase